jgi:uncharacterized protein YbjT (DUF2867 family)
VNSILGETMPIVVSGATGTVGGSLVRQLSAAGHEVRALTRDPGSPAAARLPAGVEVVGADFDDPDSLVPALRGADRLHLVAMGGALRYGERIVEVARRAGVRHIVQLGHEDPGRDDDDPLESDHRRLHRAIEGSGLAWTHVFPGEFMANTLGWAAGVRADRVVREPFGDWTSSMVHEADIAAVALAALTEDGHAGHVYRPTGPAAIQRREAVRLIGAALGEPVRFDELTPAQAREHWRDRYPAVVIDWFLQMGETPELNSWVSPDVEAVTGRPGRTFADWAVDHAADFR